ncbi:hypothetical protein ED92_33145 [Amycolatopsis sp. MJM2582]|nr:hypothetical protein ED92_33145 [Amycolatopsis sp. MJM2582]
MSEVRIVVAPPGRYGRRMIDPEALLDPRFVASIAEDLEAVSELCGLYPSARLVELASALGYRDRVAGAEFFAQGGGEMVDSKATFRAIATSAGLRVPAGFVCRTKSHAARGLRDLIDAGHSAMVKMAHGAGGAGNELVSAPGRPAPVAAGARFAHQLSSEPGAVDAYWDERWAWASQNDQHPVIVEQLLDVRESWYVELVVDQNGWDLYGMGTLSYDNGRIQCETVGISDRRAQGCVREAEKLAKIYQTLGYRGNFCVDAVVTAQGAVVYTEVNARATTGTHLHKLAADGILGDSSQLIRQVSASPNWGALSTEEFLAGVEKAGLSFSAGYDPGVLMVMPADPERKPGAFLYATIGEAGAQDDVCRALDASFRSLELADTESAMF